MRRSVSKKCILITTLLASALFFVIPQTSDASVMSTLSTLADLAAAPADFFYGLFARVLYYGLATPLSWILSLSGQIMDMAITLSLSATELFNSTAVSIGWKAVRDIFNMFFIFSLIYISIKTILERGGYATSEKLKNVIIAAVLINFSLYFTKIVIDVANVFAVWIYNGIQGITPGATSISETIKDVFSIEKMFKTEKVTDLSAFAAIIIVCFLYLGSIKVFLEISFLFITRTVMFVFLLILSPVGFVGSVFPKLEEESERWKKDLIGQALVAPVFLLLLYITLLFIDNVQKSTLLRAGGVTTDSVTHSSFTFADYVIFILMYFMIKKSLDVAKGFAGKSGDMITGAIKGGLGIALGGVGVGLAGRIASMTAKSAAVSRWAGSDNLAGRIAGRTLISASTAVANKNFGLSGAIKDTKLNEILPKTAFKGVDKGYAGKVKEEEKAKEEFAKNLGKGIKGEIARQKYAQDLKKSNSLFSRTIGAGVGGTAGLVVGGPAGALVGASIGFKGPSGAGAADDIQKKADAAFKKEAKKIADKAKKKMTEDTQVQSLLTQAKEKAEAFGDRDLVKLETELKEIQKDARNMYTQQDKIKALELAVALGREKQKIEKEIDDRKIQVLNAEIKELNKVGIKIEKGTTKDSSGDMKITDLKEVEKELDKIIKTGEAIEKQEREEKIGKVLEDKEEKPAEKPAEEPKTKPSSD